jgi:hypothetical protein
MYSFLAVCSIVVVFYGFVMIIKTHEDARDDVKKFVEINELTGESEPIGLSQSEFNGLFYVNTKGPPRTFILVPLMRYEARAFQVQHIGCSDIARPDKVRAYKKLLFLDSGMCGDGALDTSMSLFSMIPSCRNETYASFLGTCRFGDMFADFCIVQPDFGCDDCEYTPLMNQTLLPFSIQQNISMLPHITSVPISLLFIPPGGIVKVIMRITSSNPSIQHMSDLPYLTITSASNLYSASSTASFYPEQIDKGLNHSIVYGVSTSVPTGINITSFEFETWNSNLRWFVQSIEYTACEFVDIDATIVLTAPAILPLPLCPLKQKEAIICAVFFVADETIHGMQCTTVNDYANNTTFLGPTNYRFTFISPADNAAVEIISNATNNILGRMNTTNRHTSLYMTGSYIQLCSNTTFTIQVTAVPVNTTLSCNYTETVGEANPELYVSFPDIPILKTTYSLLYETESPNIEFDSYTRVNVSIHEAYAHSFCTVYWAVNMSFDALRISTNQLPIYLTAGPDSVYTTDNDAATHWSLGVAFEDSNLTIQPATFLLNHGVDYINVFAGGVGFPISNTTGLRRDAWLKGLYCKKMSSINSTMFPDKRTPYRKWIPVEPFIDYKSYSSQAGLYPSDVPRTAFESDELEFIQTTGILTESGILDMQSSLFMIPATPKARLQATVVLTSGSDAGIPRELSSPIDILVGQAINGATKDRIDFGSCATLTTQNVYNIKFATNNSKIVIWKAAVDMMKTLLEFRSQGLMPYAYLTGKNLLPIEYWKQQSASFGQSLKASESIPLYPMILFHTDNNVRLEQEPLVIGEELLSAKNGTVVVNKNIVTSDDCTTSIFLCVSMVSPHEFFQPYMYNCDYIETVKLYNL